MPYVLSVERIARQEGRQEGLLEGESTLIVRQLSKRFGSLSTEVVAQIRGLAAPQLENLGEALLDFRSLADLDGWLAGLSLDDRQWSRFQT